MLRRCRSFGSWCVACSWHFLLANFVSAVIGRKYLSPILLFADHSTVHSYNLLRLRSISRRHQAWRRILGPFIPDHQVALAVEGTSQVMAFIGFNLSKGTIVIFLRWNWFIFIHLLLLIYLWICFIWISRFGLVTALTVIWKVPISMARLVESIRVAFVSCVVIFSCFFII